LSVVIQLVPKLVKLEVNGTVILPSLVFPDITISELGKEEREGGSMLNAW
jgi:hypothetical protein